VKKASKSTTSKAGTRSQTSAWRGRTSKSSAPNATGKKTHPSGFDDSEEGNEEKSNERKVQGKKAKKAVKKGEVDSDTLMLEDRIASRRGKPTLLKKAMAQPRPKFKPFIDTPFHSYQDD
jgi:hypothetical protein